MESCSIAVLPSGFGRMQRVQCVFQGFFLFGSSGRIKDFSSSRYHGRFSCRDSLREKLLVSFQNGGPVQRSPIGTLQTWGRCSSHPNSKERKVRRRACLLFGRQKSSPSTTVQLPQNQTPESSPNCQVAMCFSTSRVRVSVLTKLQGHL